MTKVQIGTDPHTGDKAWAEVTRHCDPKRRLGYRLTYIGRGGNQVLDNKGRWIPEQEATRENSTWRHIEDAEAAAKATFR